MGKATEALEIASQVNCPSSETIKQVYRQLIYGRGHREILQFKKRAVPEMPLAPRDMNQYDIVFAFERREVR